MKVALAFTLYRQQSAKASANHGVYALGTPGVGFATWQTGMYTDVARTRAVLRVLEERERRELTHMLFVDDDNMLFADCHHILAAHGVPIVSALYFTRVEPIQPVVFDDLTTAEPIDLDPAERGLRKVGGTGMGCTLIDLRVFDSIPQPWFETPDHTGEDVFFARRCMEYGVDWYVDLDVVSGHIGEMVVGREHYEAQIVEER